MLVTLEAYDTHGGVEHAEDKHNNQRDPIQLVQGPDS